MRHRMAGKQLGRDTQQRTSLFKNLLRSLFEHGSIETTESKAKAIKGLADKLISHAQMGTLPARRLLARFFGTRQVVNKLVDEVAPAMAGRKSGFTRIVRLGKRRGDDSMMVKMELIEKAEPKVNSKVQNSETKVTPAAGSVIPEPELKTQVSGNQKRSKKK